MSILSPPQRRKYILLQGFFVVAAMVQVAGVVSVAPFIAMVANPTIIHQNPLAARLYAGMHFASDISFLKSLGLMLMAMIVLSNMVAALGVWLIVSFSLQLGVEIQEDIFHGFLHRDYVQMARTNSSALIAVVTAHVGRFVYMVMQPLLNLISQAIAAVIVIVGLIWYDHLTAIYAGILIGGGYAVVFLSMRRRLVKHGEIAWLADGNKQRLLAESLSGIKEIRLIGSERLYESAFTNITRGALRSDTIIGLMGDLPKFILESIAFCALLGLGIRLLSVSETPQSIVGVLSMYAMAGYRLLPAAQNVFKAASQIRANSPIIAELRPDILAGRTKVQITTDRQRVVLPEGDIVYDNVWFTYPDTKHATIKGISVVIHRNSVTVIVGSSGAGKSTFADLLLGLLRPSHGVIKVENTPIAANLSGWHRNLGYVPQDIFILDGTVTANISFGSGTDGDPTKVRHAARLAKIDQFIESLPNQYAHAVGDGGSLISGGQRQRVGIARALYQDVSVLVLDEATSALDTITEREILNTLMELKRTKTIVMIAHRLATIKSADKVIFMKDGAIVDAGTFDELAQRSSEFLQYVRAETEVHSLSA